MSLVRILQADRSGVRYLRESKSGKIRDEDFFAWDSVESISVFKRDLFTYDLICAALDFRDSEAVEFDEDDPLWRDFVSLLSDNLEGAMSPDSWFSEVAFPAFEERETVIYSRPKVQSEAAMD